MKKIIFAAAILFLLPLASFAQGKSAEKIYRQLNDAVVRIYTHHNDNSMHGQASGVILKEKGWIVTNYHVLGDASVIYAEHNGQYIQLDSIVAMDPKKDILILQLKNSKNKEAYKSIPNIRIADSDQLRVGQKIFAIGSPFGFENTISEGIISGLRQTENKQQNMIQISAPISSGSSGGAVLNAKGELIGISTMVIAGETAQNLNFALAINDVIAAAEKKQLRNPGSNQNPVSNYYQRGYNEYLSKNYLSAILNYEKALKESDQEDYWNIYYSIGIAYQAIGNADTAIYYLDKSLQLKKSVNTYVSIGTIYAEENKFEKAKGYFKKALELSPNSTEALNRLGVVLFLQEDFQNAINCFKKSIEINDKRALPYYMLGQISEATSNTNAAIGFYKDAVSANANYADAYLALSRVLLKLGDTENAMKYQQRAYQINPKLREAQ